MLPVMRVKKGDKVICVRDMGSSRERRSEDVVRSVGSKWITTADGMKYQLSGHGEYGYRIFTEAGLQDFEARREALATIRKYTSVDTGEVSTQSLQAAAAHLAIKPL